MLEDIDVYTDTDENNIISNVLETYNINTTYDEINLVKSYFRRKHGMSIASYYSYLAREKYHLGDY
jgi:uncharacterized protein YpuA (DUF1002 family)